MLRSDYRWFLACHSCTLGLLPFLGLPSQIFKTERNRTLPDILRSQASAARSSGNVSIIGRTPLAAANLSVSSESLEVPDGQPITDLRAIINCGDDTENGSKLTPMVTNLRQLINSGLVFSCGVFIVEKCKMPEAIGAALSGEYNAEPGTFPGEAI